MIPKGIYCYGVETWGHTLCEHSNIQSSLTGFCFNYYKITEWNKDNGSGCNFLKCPECLKESERLSSEGR